MRNLFFTIIKDNPRLTVDITEEIIFGNIPTGNIRLIFEALSSIPALVFSSICKYGGSQKLLDQSVSFIDPSSIVPIYGMIPPNLRHASLIDWDKIDTSLFPIDLFCVDRFSLSCFEKKHVFAIDSVSRLNCIKNAILGGDPIVQKKIFPYIQISDFPILMHLYITMGISLDSLIPYVPNDPTIEQYISSYLISHWRYMPSSSIIHLFEFYLGKDFNPSIHILICLCRFIRISKEDDLKKLLGKLALTWYKKIDDDRFLQSMIYLKYDYAVYTFLLCTKVISTKTLHILFNTYPPSSTILSECDHQFNIASFHPGDILPSSSILFQKNMIYWFGSYSSSQDPLLGMCRKRKRILLQ